MEKLKDRYFIRIKHKGTDAPERLPLANKQTLFRVFIHFLFGNIHSMEVWNEKYFDRKVVGNKERINGKLVRKDGATLRQKTISFYEKDNTYDNLANQFREGLYDPESSAGYANEKSNIRVFDDQQFEDAIEALTLIQEGKF